MIEKTLSAHHSFGNKDKILSLLILLEKTESLPISDCRAIGIPKGSVELLRCLGIIEENKNRIGLLVSDPVSKMPLIIYQTLFDNLKIEGILHKFLNHRSIFYDGQTNRISIKNRFIPLKFSVLRNFLADVGLFLKDEIVLSQFYVHHDFHDWFCDYVVPRIEESELGDNPLEKLIAQQGRQEKQGKEAERFVLEYEKKHRAKHTNVGKIRIISESDTAAGYDIQSYLDDNSLLLNKFIEVKSYSGEVSFYWSSNEMKIAKIKSDQYYIYLVDRNAMKNKNYKSNPN